MIDTIETIETILGYVALSYLLLATPYVIRILAMWWKEKRAEQKEAEQRALLGSWWNW